MTKLTICLATIAIAASLEVGLAGSIGHYKNWDQLRSNQIGYATDKCFALSGLLPDPKSGCCGRHAQQDEDNKDDNENNIDDENIGDTTNETGDNEISIDDYQSGITNNDDYENGNNEISNNDENYPSGIVSDDEGNDGNCGSAKCINIDNIINNVVNNVFDTIKDGVNTWMTGGSKFSGIVSLDDKKIITKKIADDNNSQPTGLSPDGVVGLIAEGRQPGLRQYPWLVYFNVKIDGFFFTTKYVCGGSLISSRFVLTAAHCFSENLRSYDDVNIFLGEYNINTSPDCVGNTCIESVLMHPDKILIHEAFEFQQTKMANDIALMRLRGSAPYTDYIRPICLPPFNIDVPNYEGVSLTTAGWGDTGHGSSPVKLAAQVQLVTQNVCKNYYSGLTPGQICAVGLTGQDICHGDSGGPMMIEKEGNFYLVGVISGKLSYSSCGSSHPSFFTNVFAYTKWIENNMKD